MRKCERNNVREGERENVRQASYFQLCNLFLTLCSVQEREKKMSVGVCVRERERENVRGM